MLPDRRPSLLLLIPLLLGVAACGEPAPVEHPDWAAPLEETNRAPKPGPASGDPHPEALETVHGDTGTYLWAHGRGFLHASLDDVAAALQDPDVVVDRREVTSWTVEHDVDPDAPVSFRVDHVVEDVVTVAFSTLWRQGHVGEEPPYYARGLKTDGTEFIAHLEDSLVLLPIGDDVTAIELMRHREAAMGGPEETAQYLRDVFESVRARVHGEALPTYGP